MDDPSSERRRRIARTLGEIAESKGFPDDEAWDFEFQMMDWLDDLDALNRVFDDPESMTREQREDAILDFLGHAPAHIVAAAKMYTGLPVRDVFEIGAVKASLPETSMHDHPVLREAAFDRAAIKKYYLWQPVLILLCTVVGVVAIPFVLIITFLVMDKYLDRLSCTLTERTLEIRKGLFNRVESTVPLDKITDLQMFQGPIMRLLGLHGFKLETAGQSAGPGGALVNILGITDTPGFRRAVLDQRDRMAEGGTRRRAEPAPAGEIEGEAAVLADIRDTLLRIEARLGERA